MWNIILSANATEVEFKLDTGADVSVIPKEMFKILKVNNLLPADSSLTGAGSQHSKFVKYLMPNYSIKNNAVIKQSMLWQVCAKLYWVAQR